MDDHTLNVTATNKLVFVDYEQEMTISCKTDHNWKTCTWLYDGKSCQFDYVFNENSVRNQWTYEKDCDAEFGDYEFKTSPGYDTGNQNKECRIKLTKVTFEGEYKCKFQRCNLEDNDFCKTEIPKNRTVFPATINVEVKLFKFKKNHLYFSLEVVFFMYCYLLKECLTI